MHACLHAIDRSKIKGGLGSLRLREERGRVTGSLRRLLKLCEQHGPLVRIMCDQTPLPVGGGTIKIACRVRRREVNETLSSAQCLIEFHVVDQVKSALRRLQHGRMRHYRMLRYETEQDSQQER